MRKHYIPMLCVLLFIFCVETRGGAAPAATTTPAQNSTLARNATLPHDGGLSQIWLTRSEDLTALVSEAESLRETAEGMAQPLTQALQTSRARFSRLSSLFQASRGHPTEQLTLLQQMRNLRNGLARSADPMNNIATTTKLRLEEVTRMQKDLAAIAEESSAYDGAAEMKNYMEQLNQAWTKLFRASARLEQIIGPTTNGLKRMDQVIEDVDHNMVGIWRDYYLTPSTTDLGAVTSTPFLLADWVTSLTSRLAFAYPQSEPEWLTALKSFLLAGVVMVVLGVIATRGAASLPEQWEEACDRIIRDAWVWIGLGLALLAASNNQFGGIYFAFVLGGSLTIIFGVAAMSWRMRIAVDSSLVDKPSPLNQLFVPAAIGVLMLFSDLPARILGVVWGLCIAAFAVYFVFLSRKRKNQDSLPLLERLSYGCAFWFVLASLLISLAGYPRMAILVFMLLFALVNTITLGNALMDLLTLMAARLFSKQTQPVLHALTEALATPIGWALSLICTLPWLWAVPGARYIVDTAMYANYTVGEASFDFSKILIILIVFFVFRSFVTLGRTTLEHLPDKMPYMEKGVIPPLRTVLTYSLWALFGLICLGMLGVNFTNLAVVAGGLSVGIGFGMQNIFNNLVSGLLLIFGRTILVGDWVDVAGASGTVKAINIRSTTIETAERALVYVPNSAIMAGQVVNWTRNSRMVRRSLHIGVAYGSDTAIVTSQLLQAAKDTDHILALPAPTVLFNDFGDNALSFTMNVFIDDFDYATSTLSNLRYTVERLFALNSIDIPYPQLTLHMPDSAPAPSPAPLAPPADACKPETLPTPKDDGGPDEAPAPFDTLVDRNLAVTEETPAEEPLLPHTPSAKHIIE